MSESAAEVQVRLTHERECARVFGQMLDAKVLRCPFTLITFGFGGGSFSSVEFKTTLTLPELIETVERLLHDWRTTPIRVIDAGAAASLELPGMDGLIAAKDFVCEQIGSRGFALVCGLGAATQYISNGARPEMVRLFEDDLLPNWRAAVQRKS